MRILTKVACGSGVLLSVAGGVFAIGASASDSSVGVAEPDFLPPVATVAIPAAATPVPFASGSTPATPPAPSAAPAPVAVTTPAAEVPQNTQSVQPQTNVSPTNAPTVTASPPPAQTPPPTPQAPTDSTGPISGTVQVPGTTMITECVVTYTTLSIDPITGQGSVVHSTSGGDCTEMQTLATSIPGAIITQETFPENSQGVGTTNQVGNSPTPGTHQSF